MGFRFELRFVFQRGGGGFGFNIALLLVLVLKHLLVASALQGAYFFFHPLGLNLSRGCLIPKLPDGWFRV